MGPAILASSLIGGGVMMMMRRTILAIMLNRDPHRGRKRLFSGGWKMTMAPVHRRTRGIREGRLQAALADSELSAGRCHGR
jgi:hypothetical protein